MPRLVVGWFWNMQFTMHWSIKTVPLFLIMMVFCTAATSARAEIDLSLGGGYLSGDTQYRIGGKTVTADETYELHFPLSELVFPLDAYMLKADLGVTFRDHWSMRLSAATNLTRETGKMEDSDWGVWNDSETLDIYSQSDTEMKALLLDGKVAYLFYIGHSPQGDLVQARGSRAIRFSFGIGLGFRYQDFEFDVYDVDQWYPFDPELGHDRVVGKVIDYEVRYKIPYLEGSISMNVAERFQLDLAVGYAPMVDFQDKDRHLLRDMVSIADHDWNGKAYFINLKGRYQLSSRWYLEASFEAMQIESKGRMDDFIGGVWDHSIAHEIESHQYSSFLAFGCSF